MHYFESRSGRVCCAVLGALTAHACTNPDLSYVEPQLLPAVTDDIQRVDSGVTNTRTSTRSDATQTSRTATSHDAAKEREAGSPVTVRAPDAADGASHDAGRTSFDASSDAGAVRSTSSDAAVSTGDAASTHTDTEGTDSAECECPESADPCLQAVCLLGVTLCTFTLLTGTACDDGDPCSVSDTCNLLGRCEGTPKDCSELDSECSEGVCDEDTGECQAAPSATATSCDDDNPCTVEDECDGAGQCEGKERDCSTLTTTCTEGVCDPESGSCVAQATNSGEVCDDDDKCTTGDICSAGGTCEGESVDCSAASSQCTLGVCDPSSGRCEAEPLTGAACDDDDSCTILDTCDDGECKGTEADTCGDAGWLDLSTRTASILMSNECAADDFDVKKRAPKESDCDQAPGRDVVFMLDLSDFDRDVTVYASTDFPETEYDTVISLMDGECSEDVVRACSDDAPGQGNVSNFEVSVEPGVYALVVDAFRENDRGEFRLEVSVD
jgi:hypothetical protein